MCPNTYSKPSLGWSKKRTGWEQGLVSQHLSLPWSLPCVNSTCRTQSAHCTVLVQWKSKTILPKCVACSVPQYNKPNARGACESGVYLIWWAIQPDDFHRTQCQYLQGTRTDLGQDIRERQTLSQLKNRCQTKQRVSTTHGETTVSTIQQTSRMQLGGDECPLLGVYHTLSYMVGKTQLETE